ncbi:MAG: hydroxyacid dehydrogenase [Opitutales bacterium]
MSKPKSIFTLGPNSKNQIYNSDALETLCQLTENDGAVHTRERILSNPGAYAEVEIGFSGWGSPVLDAELLQALPSLKAYFYGAGTVRGFVTDAFWERDILLTSAYQANAVPVAEFTVSMINLSLKRVWHYLNHLPGKGEDHGKSAIAGMYAGSRIGIISLGAIGQLVCKRLAAHDVDVFAYDPFADPSLFEACRAQRVDALEPLFEDCDVVSLHAPWLPQTENMITGHHLDSMRPGATFINTSRGKIVDEPAMIEVLKMRSDLFAVIDVIQDESDFAGHPLAALPNAVLTPHIAGSMGRECHRMGAYVVEECRRYLNGEAPMIPISREAANLLA